MALALGAPRGVSSQRPRQALPFPLRAPSSGARDAPLCPVPSSPLPPPLRSQGRLSPAVSRFQGEAAGVATTAVPQGTRVCCMGPPRARAVAPAPGTEARCCPVCSPGRAPGEHGFRKALRGATEDALSADQDTRGRWPGTAVPSLRPSSPGRAPHGSSARGPERVLDGTRHVLRSEPWGSPAQGHAQGAAHRLAGTVTAAPGRRLRLAPSPPVVASVHGGALQAFPSEVDTDSCPAAGAERPAGTLPLPRNAAAASVPSWATPG